MLTLPPNAIATNMVPEPLPLPPLPKRVEKPPLPNIKKQPTKQIQPPVDNSQNNNGHEPKFNHNKGILETTETKFTPYMPQKPKLPSKKPLENSSTKIAPSSPKKTLDTSGNKITPSSNPNPPTSPKKTMDTSGSKINPSLNKNPPSSPKKVLDTSGNRLNQTQNGPPTSPKKTMESSNNRFNTSQGGILTSPKKLYESSSTRIISTPSVYVSRQPLSTIPIAAGAFPNPREYDLTQTPPTTFSFSPNTSNRTPLGLSLSRINTPFDPNITRPKYTPAVPGTAPGSTPMVVSYASGMPNIPSTAPSRSPGTAPTRPKVEPVAEAPPLPPKPQNDNKRTVQSPSKQVPKTPNTAPEVRREVQASPGTDLTSVC
jgi:hypothetical protein